MEERGFCLSCRTELRRCRLLPSQERIRTPLTWGDEGWAIFRYEGLVKEVFHKVKFERRRDLLELFREDTALFLSRRPGLSSYEEMVAIPLDAQRRLEREFNQSGLIAGRIARTLGFKINKIRLKKRTTLPQSLLGRDERKLNLYRAFRVANPGEVQGKSVLLVDDIFTTGATLEEAAKTLKQAGASRVGYLVLARTPSD